MPSTTTQNKSVKSRLPENIFDLNNEQFYNFLANTYGNDLAQLISFQAIRNGQHLLEATIDDVLLVLNDDSAEIDELRKFCCFRVAGDEFKVKLGVKLAINNLIRELKMKQEETTKKKRQIANQKVSSSIGDVETADNPTQTNDEISSPQSLFSSASPRILSSTDSLILRLQKKSTAVAHKMDIEQRINKWWSSYNGVDDISLIEGTNYHLTINQSVNNTYTSVLLCKCGIRFKLPFIEPGFFKLSTFYRHLREKRCIQLAEVSACMNNRIMVFFLFTLPRKI